MWHELKLQNSWNIICPRNMVRVRHITVNVLHNIIIIIIIILYIILYYIILYYIILYYIILYYIILYYIIYF